MLENGDCEVCPDWKTSSKDRKSCVDPDCGDRAIITLDGTCTQCPDYERA